MSEFEQFAHDFALGVGGAVCFLATGAGMILLMGYLVGAPANYACRRMKASHEFFLWCYHREAFRAFMERKATRRKSEPAVSDNLNRCGEDEG